MNKDQLEGKWKQIKGEFKMRYGKLTDDGMACSEGKFDEMLGRLQERTGRNRVRLRNEIENWKIKKAGIIPGLFS